MLLATCAKCVYMCHELWNFSKEATKLVTMKTYTHEKIIQSVDEQLVVRVDIAVDNIDAPTSYCGEKMFCKNNPICQEDSYEQDES